LGFGRGLLLGNGQEKRHPPPTRSEAEPKSWFFNVKGAKLVKFSKLIQISKKKQ
jgi:hypothetical protein